MAKQRMCVFCRQNKVTREHVWPRWVATHFPALPGQTFTQERQLASGAITFHNAPSIEIKVKWVCASCNNTWMSQLENDAMPYLRPMFDGHRQALDLRAQALVACWAVKTALMFQYAYPEPYYVPQTTYQALYANRHKQEPPANVQVLLGRYVGSRLLGIYYQQPLSVKYTDEQEPSVEAKAYGVTLGIGQFLAQIFGHELTSVRPDRGIALKPDDTAQTFIQTIWPRHADNISWPPSYGVNDVEIDDLKLIFTRLRPM